jgi:hypothetical protein
MNRRLLYLLAAALIAVAALVVIGAGVARAGGGNSYLVTWDGYTEGGCYNAFEDVGLDADYDGALVTLTGNAAGDPPECYISVFEGWVRFHDPVGSWNTLAFDYSLETATAGGPALAPAPFVEVMLLNDGSIVGDYVYTLGSRFSERVTEYDEAIISGRSVYFDNVHMYSPSGEGSEAGAPPARVCDDDRLNCNLYDDKIVLYHGADGDSIDFFTVGPDSEGEYLFSVSAADFGDYLDNPPDVPVLIKSVGLFDVYILPTGEVQVNYGPDAYGKSYVIIMSGIDGGSPYGYTLP